MSRLFNIRRKKVGGIRFLRLGRLQFSFCLCHSFEPARKRVRKVRGIDTSGPHYSQLEHLLRQVDAERAHVMDANHYR